MNDIPRYYRTEEEFEAFRLNMKLIPCPFCQAIGMLISHGYLKGWDDSSNETTVKRGRRIFCSNRNKREGCGKTISIFRSSVIKHLRITTKQLWKFITHLSKGMNRLKAYRETGGDLKTSSIYRIYARFIHAMSPIRTRLLGVIPPPNQASRQTPFTQTVIHLMAAFKNASCPISEYQSAFQTSFL